MPHGSLLGFVGHMVSAATIDNTYKENVCAPLKQPDDSSLSIQCKLLLVAFSNLLYNVNAQ